MCLGVLWDKGQHSSGNLRMTSLERSLLCHLSQKPSCLLSYWADQISIRIPGRAKAGEGDLEV